MFPPRAAHGRSTRFALFAAWSVLLAAPGVAAAATPQLVKTFSGQTDFDRLGTAVARVDDFNGDGYFDVVVGALNSNAGGVASGSAYVHFGGPFSDSVPDLILHGQASGDRFGQSVGAADFNHDTYTDVIVGAPYNSAGGPSGDQRGRAYVYFGGPGADAIADVVLTGEAPGHHFGWSVAGAGDFNHDGFADVIVGAPDTSLAYVFYGGSNPDNVPDLKLFGELPTTQFGWSVAGIGDVNGDTSDDVVVGDPGTSTGRAYLYFGGVTPNAVSDLTFLGAGVGDRFGGTVAAAGNVNNDGFEDVIIGAHQYGFPNSGRAYVYFGGASPNNVSDFFADSEASGDDYGIAVGGAGDLNGDGYDEVMVGAPSKNAGGASAGRLYVYFGGPAMTYISAIHVDGAAGDQLGSSMAGVGDFNADGRADFAVGAPYGDLAGTDNGKTLVMTAAQPLPAYAPAGAWLLAVLLGAAGFRAMRARFGRPKRT